MPISIHPTSSTNMQIRIAALFTNKSKEAGVRKLLCADGVELVPAASVSALLAALRGGNIEALLLEDVGPELADWLGMLQLRAAGTVPVIVAGASGGLGIADALLHGAVDYIDPEAAPEQLAAHLRAHVCTQRSHRPQDLEVGPYHLSAATSTVMFEGIEISLTAREFALAWALFSKAGRIATLNSLSAHVWGRSSDVCKRTLEQHIYKLRRKLCCMGQAPMLRIQAVYSIGYRLDLATPGATWAAAAQPRAAAARRERQPVFPLGLGRAWAGA
jgi:DNA-binding response OmpR family regulator